MGSKAGGQPTRVVVVGGGAGGAEVALALKACMELLARLRQPHLVLVLTWHLSGFRLHLRRG